MAIFSSIATGKMKKSAGNAVFYRRLNKNIMRQKPLTVKNPKTTLQSYQRARIGNNAAYYRAIGAALEGIDWKQSDAANLTPYQAFVKQVAAHNTPAFNEKGSQSQFLGLSQIPLFPTFSDSWISSTTKMQPGEITNIAYVQDEDAVDNKLMINELTFKTNVLTGENYQDITDSDWAQIVAETGLKGTKDWAGIYALAEIMNYETKEHFYILRALFAAGDDAMSCFEIANYGGKDVSITFSSSASINGEMLCTIGCQNDSWHILSYTCGFAAADAEHIYIDYTTQLPLPGMYGEYAELTTFNKMKAAIKSYGGSVDKVAPGLISTPCEPVYNESTKTIFIRRAFNPNAAQGDIINNVWVLVPKKVGKETFDIVKATYNGPLTGITLSGTDDEKAAILEAAAEGHIGLIVSRQSSKTTSGGAFNNYTSTLDYFTNASKLSFKCDVLE